MIRKFLLALALCIVSSAAWAQNTQCSDRPAADSSNACANTRFVQNHVVPLPTLPSGQIFIGSMAGVAAAQTMSQDCTLSNTGVITCLRTNNVPFAPSATTDTTNANNITSGNLSVNRLNNGAGASNTTYWRGDGTWSTPAGGGGSSVLNFYPTYCTDNTGATDCTSGFNAALADQLSTAKCLYIPTGRYLISSNIDWNIHAKPTQGFCIYGDGRGDARAVIAGSALIFGGTTGVNFNIHGNTGDSLTTGRIQNLSIIGSTTGTVFQVGNSALDDAFNEIYLTGLFISNGSTAGSAVALNLNFFLNGVVDAIVNGGGYNVGTKIGSGFAALDCRQCTFTSFLGSYSLSGTGIYLRDGSNYGNVFSALTTEATTTNIAILNAGSTNNTFVGGSISLATNGIVATGGSNNVFLNTNFQAGSLTSKITGTPVGLWMKTPGNKFISTPSFPASTGTVTNTQGQTALVMFNSAATISFLAVNGVGVVSTASPSLTTVLNPGDTITVTYTGSPSWQWFPLM